MKKKKKVNKKKFFSRILLLFTIIIIIIIVMQNVVKKEEKNISQMVIINGQNATQDLLDKPYIDKDNVLYLSIRDIQKIFDKNIYYEEVSRKIITTSGTKTAAINIETNDVELNTANIKLPAGILNYDEMLYLPISVMTNIYNIEAFTTENSAIITSLYEEFITIRTTSKISIKEKASGFSKTIKRENQSTELIYIEDSEKKGWIKILTYDRKIWVCKN